MPTFGNGRRVAIVDGVRTPFTKAGTAFKAISAIDLGKLCVAELIQRTNLSGKEVEALVFGTVIPNVIAPNIAREVALMPLLPKGVQAFSVSRACASANQAITDAADQIALGHIDVDPLPFTGTVTIDTIWLKSLLFATSNRYVTPDVPEMRPLFTLNSGLLFVRVPDGDTACGGSITVGSTTVNAAVAE